MIYSSFHHQALGRFLEKSESIITVSYDGTRSICSHNPQFSRLLASPGTVNGESITRFVASDNHELLPAAGETNDLRLKLLFVDTNGQVQPLNCHIFTMEKEVLIIGEKLMHTNGAILKTMTSLNNEMANLSRELQRKNKELEQANKTIYTLRGIIPICSFCKGIRNDEGFWKELEEYVSEHTEALFSHSICPTCMEKHYPDVKV